MACCACSLQSAFACKCTWKYSHAVVYDMGLVYSIHGARKRAQNACLSSFCLSHFLSFNGLSAPRSLSGRGGHKTPSITSDLRSMASFRALILGFRHLPSTKVGLASCWSFNTTSGILRAIADTCMRRAQTLIHTCHASRCGLLKSPTHTRLLGCGTLEPTWRLHNSLLNTCTWLLDGKQ